MADGETKQDMTTETESAITRIYEVGYHISPVVADEDVEKMVGEIRSVIEKAGGSFIAEGAPTLTKLAYSIPMKENSKIVEYDRGHFGWIKFESTIAAAAELDAAIKAHTNFLRHVLFQTVREDTRAKIKMAPMREVKRVDTIKAAPRRAEESAAPVSEADLEKALLDITAE